MRADAVTVNKIPVTNTLQNTRIGNLPDSAQKTQPQLSTRSPRALMLDHSNSNDAQSFGNEDGSERADGPYHGSGSDPDHLPDTAEKTKAVKPNRGSQQYVEGKNTIPAHAHVKNGGDYATHGQAAKWAQQDAKQSRQGCGAPCIIV